MAIFVPLDRINNPMELAFMLRRKTKEFLGGVGGISSNDHVSRWEGLPLTSLEDVGEITDGGPSMEETDKEEEDDGPWYQNPKKTFKILLPHCCLLIILLSYTALGAAVLMLLESETEIQERRDKIDLLKGLYDWIANETWTLRAQNNVTRGEWDRVLHEKLSNISKVHEGESYAFLKQDPLVSRWTFPAAVLYTLTVLTTCGYDHVGPLTNSGKLFAVGFALIGIPLMFITAADIGKFLSEMLLNSWKKSKQLCAFIKLKLSCCWTKGRRRKASMSSAKSGSEEPGMSQFEIPDEDMAEGLWFPIGAYVSMICLYCALGALLYCSWENGWSFIRAFHFSFNLITTVGLGNIVVRDFVYLILITAYVIIGLAVVTMCVDLASTHLKAYFTKIHYFGRARSRFLGMSEDIREMMALVTAMRKKKGGKVTWDDVQRYLKYEQQLALRPFTPRHLHMWHYIDETSSALSGTLQRHSSYQSDLYSMSSHGVPRRTSKNNSIMRGQQYHHHHHSEAGGPHSHSNHSHPMQPHGHGVAFGGAQMNAAPLPVAHNTPAAAGSISLHPPNGNIGYN